MRLSSHRSFFVRWQQPQLVTLWGKVGILLEDAKFDIFHSVCCLLIASHSLLSDFRLMIDAFPRGGKHDCLQEAMEYVPPI